MYPKIYADYFRDFDVAPEVFVAMPFTADGESRLRRIFKPAIKAISLRPFTVRGRAVSDSILTDIIAAIGRAQLLLVDLTFQIQGDRPPGPNPNVLYELGLAHAMRLPEEVVVVRGDSLPNKPPFDISQIRYHMFDQADAPRAVRRIRDLLHQSLRALDRTRDQIVIRTLCTLDPDHLRFLYTVRKLPSFDLAPFDPDRKGLYGLGANDTTEVRLRAIARSLVAGGVLRAGNPGSLKRRIYGATPEYEITMLGRAVIAKLPRWVSAEGA
jgi:hypothetical protein